MEPEKIEEIKSFGKTQVEKLLGTRATIEYKKFHKTMWGVTKHDKESDPVTYSIEIYHGVNFEDDFKFVGDNAKYHADFIKDTILHEIAHALVGVKVCTHHSHDKIWKESCLSIGAMPSSGATPLSFRLWKEGITNYSILGVPKDVRMNINTEDYKHLSIEVQNGARNRAKTTVAGNVVLGCPKCNGVWIRKTDTEKHTYYCSVCEIPVDDITDHWEEMFDHNELPSYVVKVVAAEENIEA